MIKVTAEVVTGREWVHRAMKATMGHFGDDELRFLSDKTFLHLLRAKHSPIEEYRFWFDIVAPERVHTHVMRHEEIGKYVASSRPDLKYCTELEDDHRSFSLQINAKRLIEIMQLRLCGKAWGDTQQLFIQMRNAVVECSPVFDKVLHPTCVWYDTCLEKPCCRYIITKEGQEARESFCKGAVND